MKFFWHLLFGKLSTRCFNKLECIFWFFLNGCDMSVSPQAATSCCEIGVSVVVLLMQIWVCHSQIAWPSFCSSGWISFTFSYAEKHRINMFLAQQVWHGQHFVKYHKETLPGHYMAQKNLCEKFLMSLQKVRSSRNAILWRTWIRFLKLNKELFLWLEKVYS